MIAVCLIILSLVEIILTIYFFYNIRKFFINKIIFDFVLYIMLISQLLFKILPCVLRLLSGWKYERSVDVLQEEVAHVYMIEFFSVTIWLVTIWLVTKLLRNRTFVIFSFKSFLGIFNEFKRDGKEYLFRYVTNKVNSNKIINFSIVVIILNAAYLYFPSTGGHNSLIPSLDWLIYPFVIKSGKLFALLLLLLGPKSVGLFRYLAVIFLSFYLYLFDFTDGSLGSIIAPVSYIFFAVIFIKPNKVLLILGSLGILFVLLFYGEMHSMRSYDYNKSNMERFTSILTSINTVNQDESILVDKLNYRLGVPSKMSVGYIRMYDDNRDAGFKPFVNSLFALMPKRFYPNKPVSGSLDGDKLSTGPHLINNEIERSIQNMSGHFTGLHSYWEGGYLGVFFLSILSGIYTYILFSLLDRLGSASLFFILVAYDTWWGIVKLWSSEIVIQVVTYMGPLLLMYYFFGIVFKFIRTVKFRSNKSRKYI